LIMNGENNPDRHIPTCVCCGVRRASIHRLFCDKCWTDVECAKAEIVKAGLAHAAKVEEKLAVKS
jgi:hypothetical protein